MCGVAQHAEDTPGQSRRDTKPGNDVAALENEQVVYVPNDNYRNLSREAKHPRELLKDYINHIRPLTGKAGINRSFSGVPIHLLIFFVFGGKLLCAGWCNAAINCFWKIWVILKRTNLR